jgi:hypothetical protein
MSGPGSVAVAERVRAFPVPAKVGQRDCHSGCPEGVIGLVPAVRHDGAAMYPRYEPRAARRIARNMYADMYRARALHYLPRADCADF